jgi:hypothetical protein
MPNAMVKAKLPRSTNSIVCLPLIQPYAGIRRDVSAIDRFARLQIVAEAA